MKRFSKHKSVKFIAVLLILLQLLVFSSCSIPAGSSDTDKDTGATTGFESVSGNNSAANANNAAQGSGETTQNTQSTQSTLEGSQSDAADTQSTQAAGNSTQGTQAGSQSTVAGSQSTQVAQTTETGNVNQSSGSSSQSTSGAGANTGGSTQVAANSSASSSVSVPGRIPVVLYYQDGDGCLIPVTRWIERQQGIARAALYGLIDSAVNREELQYYGLYPVIPANTDILGINISEGIATVDFNTSLLNFRDAAGERNMLAAVVYTLTGFSTIEGVRILVNGFEQIELPNGTEIGGIFTREHIMLNTTEQLYGVDFGKADVYMLKQVNDEFTYFIPVSVLYAGNGVNPDPGILMEQLVQTAAEQGIVSEIPQGTEILSAEIRNGILTIDFNGTLAEYSGKDKEAAIIKQILYTAGQLGNVSKVKILINGDTALLPEGTDLSSPLPVPPRINDVVDNS